MCSVMYWYLYLYTVFASSVPDYLGRDMRYLQCDDHMRTVEDWRLQGDWGLKYLGRFGHQTPDTPESLLVCLTCPIMHVIELDQDAERGGKRRAGIESENERFNCCGSCSSHCYIGHDETVSSCHRGWPLLPCWISTPDKASWIAVV